MRRPVRDSLVDAGLGSCLIIAVVALLLTIVMQALGIGAWLQRDNRGSNFGLVGALSFPWH